MKLANNAMHGCIFVTYTDICKHIMFTLHHGTTTKFHLHLTTVSRKQKHTVDMYTKQTLHKEDISSYFPVLLMLTQMLIRYVWHIIF